MTVSRTVTFEYAATPDQLAALLLNPTFLRSRSVAAGDRDIDIQISEHSGATQLVVSRERTIDVPAFVKGVIDPTQRATERTTWRREGQRWTAEFSLEVQGMPGRASGRSTISAYKAGSRYESTFEVTAKLPIPFVGPKIEKLLADGLAEQLLFNADQNAAALASGNYRTPAQQELR